MRLRVERGPGIPAVSHTRWLGVYWGRRNVIDCTYRLARWDRRRGRYFELWVGMRRVV
jgi:hypothetical protein